MWVSVIRIEHVNPASSYLFKVNNRNTWKKKSNVKDVKIVQI